jgi:hypothetical protein
MNRIDLANIEDRERSSVESKEGEYGCEIVGMSVNEDVRSPDPTNACELMSRFEQ